MSMNAAYISPIDREGSGWACLYFMTQFKVHDSFYLPLSEHHKLVCDFRQRLADALDTFLTTASSLPSMFSKKALTIWNFTLASKFAQWENVSTSSVAKMREFLQTPPILCTQPSARPFPLFSLVLSQFLRLLGNSVVLILNDSDSTCSNFFQMPAIDEENHESPVSAFFVGTRSNESTVFKWSCINHDLLLQNLNIHSTTRFEICPAQKFVERYGITSVQVYSCFSPCVIFFIVEYIDCYNFLCGFIDV
jgi:hypothetical protein